MIILDDDEIERTEYFGFNVHLQTGVDPHFSDFTQINIIDDEGEFPICETIYAAPCYF